MSELKNKKHGYAIDEVCNRDGCDDLIMECSDPEDSYPFCCSCGWNDDGDDNDLKPQENEVDRKALQDLVSACEEDFKWDLSRDLPDNESVSSRMDLDGNIYDGRITFGMIRRARAALDKGDN